MPQAPTIISDNDLTSLCCDAGFGGVDIRCRKPFYAMPSPAWLPGPVQEIWPSAMRVLGIEQYKMGSWNCVDFARMFQCYCAILHSRTAAAPAVGFAVGVALMLKTPPPNHALNVAAVQLEDGSRILQWFDPQIPVMLTLTKAQVEELIYDIEF